MDVENVKSDLLLLVCVRKDIRLAQKPLVKLSRVGDRLTRVSLEKAVKTKRACDCGSN